MRNKEKKYGGIYFEIDTLFDTRLGTLRKLNSELADKEMMEGYFSRERDEFKYFSREEFMEAYATRDLETLGLSNPTTFLMEINEHINIEAIKPMMAGVATQPMMFLNIYPYKFSPEALNEVVNSIRHLTSFKIGVKVLNTKPEGLTPHYVDENINAMFMYDWDRWINAHIHTLANGRLEDVYLYGSRIYPISTEEAMVQVNEMKEKLLNEGMVVKNNNEYDAFDQLEALARVFISLSFMEEQDFNQVLPKGMPLPEAT